MAISELQIALIGAGAAAVGMVWGYNAWQDRKHRRIAEGIFKGGQGDALLGAAEPGRNAGDGERREPHFADEVDAAGEPAADADVAESLAEPLAEVDAAAEFIAAERLPAQAEPPAPLPQAAPLSEPALLPGLPAECADAVADCVLYLTAAEALPAPAVWAIQNAWAGDLSKPLRWLARQEADAAWQPVEAADAGRYRDWAAALQLVDRRGPVSDAELGRFFDGVQQLAKQTGAVLELPSRGEIVIRAGKLDEFCAAVDIQFGLHIVEASGGVFAGTKLRGVAEAAGLVLEDDGLFRARDEAGGELFTVANLGAERLEAASIKSLATHGLTLSLDVPRVSDGVRAFDRMLATARQLATALGGVLVDAQRAPLADAMIAAIRAKTAELQQRMRDGGIAPGSTRALRLFS
ncbi:MAG: cell division protein ZipA C-terminal FtsZ-binding domain-containing protein [Rhodocyclales bacterium]|nr:cell division protein ZipA C-terminal FtsZ-binding domain-containing protein [Rhodocyclales bacterium]